MAAMIIAIILALISYFTAKKSGASSGEAALVAAGVGAGSYYVGTQTDWGRDTVSWASDKWTTLTGIGGATITNDDGSIPKAPPGATATYDSEGNVVKDANGNVMWKLLDSTGNVLTSWGPTGTAAVIGTAGLTASGGLEKSLPWIAAGVVAVLLIAK